MNKTFFKEYNLKNSNQAKEIAQLIGNTMINYFLQFHPGSYIASSIKIEGNKVYIDAPKYNMKDVAKKGLNVLKFDYSTSYADELDQNGAKIAVRERKGKGSRVKINIVQTTKHKDYVETEIMFALYKWCDRHGYILASYKEDGGEEI